jgi:hypothetical protein
VCNSGFRRLITSRVGFDLPEPFERLRHAILPRPRRRFAQRDSLPQHADRRLVVAERAVRAPELSEQSALTFGLAVELRAHERHRLIDVMLRAQRPLQHARLW